MGRPSSKAYSRRMTALSVSIMETCETSALNSKTAAVEPLPDLPSLLLSQHVALLLASSLRYANLSLLPPVVSTTLQSSHLCFTNGSTRLFSSPSTGNSGNTAPNVYSLSCFRLLPKPKPAATFPPSVFSRSCVMLCIYNVTAVMHTVHVFGLSLHACFQLQDLFHW